MARRIVSALAVMAATFAGGGFLAGRAASEEPPPGMTPEMAEKMKEWEMLKTPGPAHEVLKGLAGNWLGTGKWTEGGMTMDFKEEASAKLLYGGRFVQTESRMTTEMPGMPPFTMNSLSYLGYDNAKQKYVHHMLGDMSTAIGTAEGTYDTATKTFSMEGVEDMGGGKQRKFRVIQKIVSADEFLFEIYFTPPGGTESKAGEATYKRKAATAEPNVRVTVPGATPATVRVNVAAPRRGCCPPASTAPAGEIRHVRTRP